MTAVACIVAALVLLDVGFAAGCWWAAEQADRDAVAAEDFDDHTDDALAAVADEPVPYWPAADAPTEVLPRLYALPGGAAS